MPQLAGSGQGRKQERNSDKSLVHRELPFDWLCAKGTPHILSNLEASEQLLGLWVREGFALPNINAEDWGSSPRQISAAKNWEHQFFSLGKSGCQIVNETCQAQAQHTRIPASN